MMVLKLLLVQVPKNWNNTNNHAYLTILSCRCIFNPLLHLMEKLFHYAS